MKPKKNKDRRIIIPIIVIVVLIIIAMGNCFLSVTEYTIPLTELEGSAKVVVISDLHGKEYGRENKRLVSKISEQKPDAIFVVGDMFDDEVENGFSETVKLLNRLLDIAPVYFSYGNHEKERDSDIIDEFEETVIENGVVVLDDSFVDCEIGGQKIRVGGTMGHAFPFGRTKEEFENSNEYIFLKDMEGTPLPTIVLAHMPDTFIFNGAHKYWNNIDLVVSGHTHGGVIRLPFVGGLYSPMQGIFPEYDCGFYMLGENMNMVITSGLSGYKFIPRVFNLPEICVLNLTEK